MADQLPSEIAPARVSRLLTAAEFHQLADVPPEVEWFANISNRHTRRAYENAVKDFMRFAGIERPEEFRTVTRAHIIAWRDDLVRRGSDNGGSPIRHRLASLASLFEYLCEKNAVNHNPVKGVEGPTGASPSEHRSTCHSNTHIPIAYGNNAEWPPSRVGTRRRTRGHKPIFDLPLRHEREKFLLIFVPVGLVALERLQHRSVG